VWHKFGTQCSFSVAVTNSLRIVRCDTSWQKHWYAAGPKDLRGDSLPFKSQKLLDTIGPAPSMGRDWPLEKHGFAGICYHAEFGRSRLNGTNEKNSRLSRSLNIIRTGADRLWLPIVIHSNHGLLSYRFREEPRFRSKIVKFPSSHPVYLVTRLRGSPWNFVMQWDQRTRRAPYQVL